MSQAVHVPENQYPPSPPMSWKWPTRRASVMRPWQKEQVPAGAPCKSAAVCWKAWNNVLPSASLFMGVQGELEVGP
jgi:hypothetical protein